uniref:hypothetical protein n=1 Tax=Gordonia sp. B7-2 TaxID=3420932 RepID=UPI003D8C9E01
MHTLTITQQPLPHTHRRRIPPHAADNCPATAFACAVAAVNVDNACPSFAAAAGAAGVAAAAAVAVTDAA